MSVCVTEKLKYFYTLLNLPWNHLQSCHHYNLLYVDIPCYPIPCKDYAFKHVGWVILVSGNYAARGNVMCQHLYKGLGNQKLALNGNIEISTSGL